MGSYINLVAKPGCEEQINTAWAAFSGDSTGFLVYSEKVIEAEIAYIHSPKGKELAHLRPYMKSVSDWDEIYPGNRQGNGSFKVSGLDDEDTEDMKKVKQKIEFVLDNRMLFVSITGLDDAREQGMTGFVGDSIINNQVVKRPEVVEPGFAALRKGDSALYRNCVAHNRPDLWKAYLDFEAEANEANWIALRQKLVPWTPQVFGGVWGLVENFATQVDGKSFGLIGRFRDGKVPTLLLVRQALAEQATKDHRMEAHA